MTSPNQPAGLIELATAYWHSATLIAAVRLDLFSALAHGPLTASEVAARINASEVATEALLAALAALDLVCRHADGRFANQPVASRFLVRDQPGFLGPALLYNGDVFPLWARLHEVVQSGEVARSPETYLGQDPQQTRNFVYGMHHRALGVGRGVAEAIDLRGCKRLADIGGGPGTYASLLVGRTDGLEACVLDLPAVTTIAREIVKSMGFADRVRCQAFDYYTDALAGEYDAALISGVLHREQPPQAKALLAKVAAAMVPGGILYISDVMLNDDRTGPLFATMFALNMRVLAHNGRCHSVAEQSAWLAEAGFEVQQALQLPAPIHYTLIRARKKT